MTTVRNRLTGGVVTLVLLGLLCAMVTAAPASAFADEVPVLVISPQATRRGDVISMRFASPQHCQGDSEAGYLWQTFITPSSGDPAALTFSIGLPQGGGFTAGLRDSTQSWIRNRNPGLTDGQVIPPENVTFAGSAFDQMSDGEYLIGIACTKQTSQGVTKATRVWARRIVVTGFPSSRALMSLVDDVMPAATAMPSTTTVVLAEPAGAASLATVPVSSEVIGADTTAPTTAEPNGVSDVVDIPQSGPLRNAEPASVTTKGRRSTGVVLGLLAAGVALVIVAVVLFVSRRRRREFAA